MLPLSYPAQMSRTDQSDIEQLGERIGEPHLRHRLELQIEKADEIYGTGATLFHIENMEWLMALLYWTLRLTGLYGVGCRNYRDIRVQRNIIPAQGLPAEFSGFKVLHISDLHIDLTAGFTDAVVERLHDLEYDLCAITGDFRAHTIGEYDRTLQEMEVLLPHLRQPVMAILGNHDFIQMVPPLERMGCRFLLNERITLSRGNARLHLAGVDDAHFYQADNLHKALEGVPLNEFCLLLAHTPEIYRKAAATGCNLVLTGHTHGGQICLPGALPIVRNADVPGRMVAGNWKHRGLQGFTSRGTGACGVPVRFFCPPEIVIHELVAVPAENPDASDKLHPSDRSDQSDSSDQSD